MKRILALGIAALGLPGCATMVQDDWLPHPTHAPLPVKHFEVADRDLNRVCAIHTPGRLYGCAIRVADARLCIIYTPPQPAAWVMDHERKHCAGWDHGPLRHGTATNLAAIGN